MDISCLDLKRIREEYLNMTLRELSTAIGCTAPYCFRAENSKNPPEEYIRKIQVLLLERRVQVLENIIKGAEHDTKFLKEFKAADTAADTSEKI